jgi:predicted CXXCH cytochrome family protein
MKNQRGTLYTCAAVFALTVLLGGYSILSTPAPASAAASKKASAADAAKPAKTDAKPTAAAAPAAKAACLACHGPYEKIIAKTADYMMQSGEQEIKSNPHRYVPHDSKDIKDIPECSYCHEPHPVPLAAKEGLPKPKATWCYGCHHAKVLACGTCH